MNNRTFRHLLIGLTNISERFKESDKKRIVHTSNGTIFYYSETGELHREDGPAIIWKNGDRWYYKRGMLHRENGPAIEGEEDDPSHVEYFFNDQKCMLGDSLVSNQEEFERWKKLNILS